MKTLTEIIDTECELTDGQLDGMVDLFGKGCRSMTKSRLRSILTYSLSRIGNYGIYGRVRFDGDKVTYCAGQSYPDEIRTVRELILK